MVSKPGIILKGKNQMSLFKSIQWKIACILVVYAVGAFPLAYAEDITLPAPVISGMTVNTILDNRQNTAAFMTDGLSEQMVSDLLWATCGINRPLTGGRTTNFSYNSRDTLIYLASANGVFLYDPLEHALVKKSGTDIRSVVNPAYPSAPLTLIYVSSYSRFFAAIHAGFCAENVSLYCADKGLGALTREGISANLAGLGLTSAQKGFMVQTIGYKEGSAVAEPAWALAEQPMIPANVNGAPLLKILKERRSTSSFSSTGFSTQTLGELLWAGFGVNDEATGGRTAPVLGGTNDVDIYAILATGAYAYRPASHTLEQITTVDLRSTLGYASVPAIFIYVSDYSKLTGITDQAAYAGMHCGFVAQNVSAYCASEGIGHKIRSSVSSVATQLGLTSTQHIVFTQTFGYPSSTPSSAVTITAGTGGSVTGVLSQTIAYRGSGSSVTAVANAGYAFSYWSGLPGGRETANPLTLENVVCPMAITANFVPAMNQPPQISSLPGITKSEGETVQFDITVSDADSADVITLSSSALPSNATLNKIANRTWQFSWLTDFSSAGDYSLIFTANDGKENSESVTAVITVSDVPTKLGLSDKPEWFQENNN